ncbi:MAG TPA: glycogen synthase [Candidatus Limnocylindrales bacterium]|nr:glycogen synthase [Candidatus Limnocylindrales bacterium]
MSDAFRALLLTNEYPPNVYGGAGVHVEYLARELARLIEVDVRAFGDQDVADAALRARGVQVPIDLARVPDTLRPVFGAFARNLAWLAEPVDADVVHCHTWYSHLGGIVAKLAYGIPLVITTHSLEPLRPWKREQLGGGYDASAWVERTAIELADAVIAVSRETREDVLRLFRVEQERVHVIHNGIDTDEYRPQQGTDALVRYSVDPAVPYVLFVGRITRQKGIIHLVRALRHLDPEVQVVLAAGAPDTKEIAAEMEAAVADARRAHPRLVWIAEMVDKPSVRQLYSHAAVFCCPSVYEPFGIINLEAMACETAVVASAVGGIPEVVVDGETGLLVPFESAGGTSFEPRDPGAFERGLADGIMTLMRDPARREAMARAGRTRAVEHFSWSSIAARTVELYRSLEPRR